MKRKALQCAALLCLVAGIWTFVIASIGRREGGLQTKNLGVVAEKKPKAESAAWMTDYTLTERSGRQFDSKELDDKVHVVNFFFASCPTVCRFQSGRVKELAREFGPQGVQFLSITCDPANDTPVTLQNYAKSFDADREQWLFLTSTDLNYLRRVGAEVYELPVDKQVHSENLVVVDRWGTLRGYYHWNKPEEIVEMKTSLGALLAETKPPAEITDH